MRKILSGLALLGLMALQTACAPQNFSPVESGDFAMNGIDADGDGIVDVDGNGGSGSVPAEGSIPGNGTPGSGGPGGGMTVPENLPTASFKIPTCQADSNCQVRAVLKFPDTRSVSFDWKTDDEQYRAAGALPNTAVPNAHYVPTSGKVNFLPGSTEQPMNIQTLHDFTYILIYFKYWNCRVDGKPISCEVLFPQT